jgi:Brp/Blh family beta-carotene 15,15'-monooxygenase
MKDGTPLVLILFCSLLTCALVAPTTAEWIALALMICAGIPHGSFDLRVAEAKWRDAPLSRYTILAAYLLSVVGMAALCVFVPPLGLSLFLIISAVHFSEGEIRSTKPPSVMMGTALGLCAIVLPIGLHPQQSQVYTSYFLSQELFMRIETPLELISHIAAYLVAISLVVSLRPSSRRTASETLQRLICLSAWLMLPPLSGFAVWFIGCHSRQHLETCRSMFDGERFRIPMDFVAISTLAILGLAPFSLRFDFSRLEELFAASICLIAGLTLPHMIVSHRMQEALGGRSDPST